MDSKKERERIPLGNDRQPSHRVYYYTFLSKAYRASRAYSLQLEDTPPNARSLHVSPCGTPTTETLSSLPISITRSVLLVMRFSSALTRPALAARSARNARSYVMPSLSHRAKEAPVSAASISEQTGQANGRIGEEGRGWSIGKRRNEECAVLTSRTLANTKDTP